MHCGTATFWEATFSEPLLFKGPARAFARATFSKDTVFQKSYFSTGNLVQLLDLKVPVGWGEGGRVRKVMHYSENLSIKCQDQNICIETVFSGQHWTGHTIDECENVLLLGNFSTKF